jgi:hypothetical protein
MGETAACGRDRPGGLGVIVMAGLVPAIHALIAKKGVDARDKRRHDESRDIGPV